MNEKTAKILLGINNDFYRKVSDSFSSTREHPWHGWRNLDVLGELCAGDAPIFSVFDLACGNLRFESFLTAELPDAALTFYAVDNCDALMPSTPAAHYQSLDVLEALQHGDDLAKLIRAPRCDLSVSFGFLHHVPLQSWRQKILATLVGKTRPGGFVVVSFWQFLNNDALGEKARRTHERALEELGLPALDEGDYLLGWQDIPGVYRYCHSFSEAEIDRLAASLAGTATVVSRFVSDGRSDNLNTYLVLKVH